MPDSIDSMHGRILDLAIEMADALNAEAGANERNLETTVTARRTASKKREELKILVKELHRREKRAG